MIRNMSKFWKVYWKFHLAITVIIIIIILFVFAPKLTINKGKILIDLGEYHGYEYAFNNTSNVPDDRGVFRKGKDDKDFYRISEYVPLGDDNFFYHDNTAIFTPRAYNIVKINLKTLEEEYYEYTNMALVVIGGSNKYIIATDADNHSYIKILDLKTMKVIDSIEMTPYKLEVNITDTYIEFEDYKSKKWYKYYFEDKKTVQINNQS